MEGTVHASIPHNVVLFNMRKDFMIENRHLLIKYVNYKYVMERSMGIEW